MQERTNINLVGVQGKEIQNIAEVLCEKNKS